MKIHRRDVEYGKENKVADGVSTNPLFLFSFSSANSASLR
jgi:hypothetical protein